MDRPRQRPPGDEDVNLSPRPTLLTPSSAARHGDINVVSLGFALASAKRFGGVEFR
jgi:hypothetical protein